MKKKWFFVVIALLLIAAVLTVVFVMLFKDKNTKSFAEDLNATVTTGYLSTESDEYNVVSGYLEKYEGMASVITGEDAEVTNYRLAYKAYTNIALFFNNEAPFMEHTKTYSKNRKKIVSALNSAQKNADKMAKIVKEKGNYTGGNETWERVVWRNYKHYVQDMVYDTMKAFELLSNVYSASVSSSLMNNDLSDVLFLGLKQLNKEFKKDVEKVPNLGYKLNEFSESSFSQEKVESSILTYNYTPESNHNKMKDILSKGVESNYWGQVLNGQVLRGY